ncbi:MAG: pyrimidine dimer DNA glycosylase/endonuclease V [Candidatus Bathyarchaeota archaeon]|nr:pyrimidine dimer DNA glycosylase/endonuclease V [Candidatus Bathyarchaeota archaeon]
MRIWSIHPRYLDWKGLGAQWRETLLVQKVLQGGTKGWVNHPQLDRFKNHPDPMKAVGYFLMEVHRESLCRGYKYNYEKILYPVKEVEKITLNRGQLDYEFEILMERLAKRTPVKHSENMDVELVEAHPIFDVIDGPPELWEKAYWREYTPD